MTDPTGDLSVCDRLAAHLDALLLDDAERLLLDTILDRAADAGAGDVEGFAFQATPSDLRSREAAKKLKPVSLSPGGIRIAEAVGFKL